MRCVGADGMLVGEAQIQRSDIFLKIRAPLVGQDRDDVCTAGKQSDEGKLSGA
ncbi:MAG: hypothetical protein ABI992_01490 [Chthoniobacterales bacterium]